MSRAALLSALALAAALPASSASALDCNRRLVVVGDPAIYVRDICGEPAQITTRTESRTQFVSLPGRGAVIGAAHTVTVEIEVWIYDFGPRRFMEELTFENGILRSLRPLGYGRRRASLDRVPLRVPRRVAILRTRET
jgi:hypothetical protein